MKNILFILLAITLSSCFKDRIDIDLNEDNQKVVITSWITDLDEPQFVTLGKTRNYLGSEGQQFISGAMVSLRDDSDTYVLSEGDSGKYYLPSDWQAIYGVTYVLTVEIGEVEYVASHMMRACPVLENVNYIIYESDDIEEEEVTTDSIHIYGTLFDFQETEGKGDAYYTIDYLKGTTAGDSMRNGFFANDEFVDGEYFEEIDISEFDRLYAIGDTAIIEFYSIGKESANYLMDIESEIFRGGPFDPPPANVRTNFTGGAVGYFIISGAQQVEIVIE